MQENTINIEGKNISYYDNNLKTTPIIFIHGFPFDKKTWLPQMQELGKTYRVIAYDLSGFGNSDAETDTVSIKNFGNELINLMDNLKIEKAYICGLSMGGYITLNALFRFPARFAGVILADTQCIADSPEGKEKRYKTIESINANGLTDFAAGYVKMVFHENTLNSNNQVVNQIENTILNTKTDSITQTLAALAERDATCNMLQDVTVPACIICGEFDKVTPPERAQFLHDSIKHSELHIIENAGHLSNLEQSAIFNEKIAGFLAGINE